MTVLNSVRTAVQKRLAYSNLKYQLANMPLETAIDLGLFREDAAKTAAKAIYG
ncbi:hypothetical protein [Loktanella sp. Alg231-35]|uniref:hypothetical protein n=1 Tax=Loktanella sp. Alg231-35 TaxID=1922220 RepID=UPI0018FF6EAD|nr:hypothetical protein [Loktanella sp. Alg231-35]